MARNRVLSQREIDELLSFGDSERRRKRMWRKRREECQYERYWIIVKKVDSKKLFFMPYVASQIRLLAHLAFALHSHCAGGAYCRNHLCM